MMICYLVIIIHLKSLNLKFQLLHFKNEMEKHLIIGLNIHTKEEIYFLKIMMLDHQIERKINERLCTKKINKN